MRGPVDPQPLPYVLNQTNFFLLHPFFLTYLKLVTAITKELIVLLNVLKFRPLANWDAGSVQVVSLCAANTEQEW